VAVTALEIKTRAPFAGGIAFGEAGAYEQIEGTVRFGVDPELPANRAIVDLDKAARDPSSVGTGYVGRVQFAADFSILQPVDPARGSRRLLFEVTNRGRRNAMRQFNRAPITPPDTLDPGDGFLMRHGWTVGWCGWQWDVVPAPGLLALEAPQALENGRPIEGRIAVEFQPSALSADKLLANRIHRPYPVADLNDPDAQLSVRQG
jgi:hypothetical protein